MKSHGFLPEDSLLSFGHRKGGNFGRHGTAKSWENRSGKCENYGKHVERHGGGSIKKQKEPQILVYVFSLYLISS